MDKQLAEALAVLGIPADSDHARTVSAYRRLARSTHPDVSPAADAAEQFATVAAAYRRASASIQPPRSSARPSARPTGTSSAARRSCTPPGLPTVATDPAWTRSRLLFSISPLLSTESGPPPPIVAGPVMVLPGGGQAGGVRREWWR